MFRDLASIGNLLQSSVSEFRRQKSDNICDQVYFDLLKTYYYLKDGVEEGKKLIIEAGSEPITKIKLMDEFTAASTLKRWESTLYRQSRRLGILQGYVNGQDCLAVLNPSVQEKIADIVGYKLN